jgi:RNA ligase
MTATLFEQGELDAAIAAGLVRVQPHPTLPYSIFNYTEACAYSRAWTDVTRACRGLILRSDTGEVIARAFDKFWNHDEPESGYAVATGGPVTVTSKEDGSLGVLYPVGDAEFAVATRGSFVSEQASHATQVWRERYAGRWVPPTGMTALFEIVYPANRIVLDYGGFDDLILLGFVETATGRTVGPDAFVHGWPGRRARTLPYDSFAEALADEPGDGVEGYVVHFLDTDQRVKIKGEWYRTLHKIVTGLNARAVWEHLRNGRLLADLLVAIPDEFRPWAQETGEGLEMQVANMAGEVEREYYAITARLSRDATRKDFALIAKASPQAPALFRRLDGRDYRDLLWRQIDPGIEARPTMFDPTMSARGELQ